MNMNVFVRMVCAWLPVLVLQFAYQTESAEADESKPVSVAVIGMPDASNRTDIVSLQIAEALSKTTGIVTLERKEIDRATAADKQAAVIIKGEGFSEFALRRGNLISVKARLEVTAVDRATDKIIATDRQTSVEVDLTEQIAGKKALQTAAVAIAERLLPKLVK